MNYQKSSVIIKAIYKVYSANIRSVLHQMQEGVFKINFLIGALWRSFPPVLSVPQLSGDLFQKQSDNLVEL